MFVENSWYKIREGLYGKYVETYNGNPMFRLYRPDLETINEEWDKYDDGVEFPYESARHFEILSCEMSEKLEKQINEKEEVKNE